MHPHVQKALDGDISPRVLTTSERAELFEAESAIDAVRRAIPVNPFPDLAPAVLRQIRQESSRARAQTGAPRPLDTSRPTRSVAGWLWQPRSISVTWRPAYALAAAVVFIAAVGAGSMRRGPAVVAGAPKVFTEFVLQAPNAARVAVAGDFTGWQPVHVMTRTEAGLWTVVIPLAPGVHDYSFVVDGERWVPDPTAPAVNDGFGGVNSRLAVLSPDGGRS